MSEQLPRLFGNSRRSVFFGQIDRQSGAVDRPQSLIVLVNRENPGTLGLETLGNRESDATSGARDDRRLLIKSHRLFATPLR